MKRKEQSKLTIDQYLNISKSDVIVYVIITIIVFFVLLYISYKNNFYYLLLLDIIMIGKILERIETCYTLKKIKLYLMENNLLDKIGEIDYWNEKNYFLTENYLIIKQNKKIYHVKYSEIERILKTSNIQLSRHSKLEEYLDIITPNNAFRILTFTTVLIGEDFRDIIPYLLSKNPKIKIETKKNKEIDIFRRENKMNID